MSTAEDGGPKAGDKRPLEADSATCDPEAAPATADDEGADANDGEGAEADADGEDEGQQKDDRLRKNREKARDRRNRKKALIEDMQRNVVVLSRMNSDLRRKNQELIRSLAQYGAAGNPGMDGTAGADFQQAAAAGSNPLMQVQMGGGNLPMVAAPGGADGGFGGGIPPTSGSEGTQNATLAANFLGGLNLQQLAGNPALLNLLTQQVQGMQQSGMMQQQQQQPAAAQLQGMMSAQAPPAQGTARAAPGAGAQGAVGQNGAPVHIVFHHHHDAAAAGQGGAMTQVGSNQMQQQQAAGAQQQQQQQQAAIPDLPKMLNFPGGSVAPPS